MTVQKRLCLLAVAVAVTLVVIEGANAWLMPTRAAAAQHLRIV